MLIISYIMFYRFKFDNVWVIEIIFFFLVKEIIYLIIENFNYKEFNFYFW